MDTSSGGRGRFTPQERQARADARAAGLRMYREAGGKSGLKAKRRTKRRTYGRRRSYGSKFGLRSFTTRGNATFGTGAYTAPKSAAFGEQVGNTIGGFLPGPYKLAAPLLGKAGGWLANKIGSWLGLGAYDLNRNSIVLDEGSSPAMMHSTDDTIIVRHREYVGEVFSSPVAGAFTVQNFALQPGNSALFEWLAPIANQFQEWIPMGIVAEFKSNSGEVVSGPTNALGQVIMATDYNAFNTDPFQNKSQMNNTVYSTNAKITQSFVHAIECDPKKNVMESFFVRAGPVPPGQPPQLYDLGTFAIASHGCQGASQDLGELWFSYEIGLRKASLIQTYAAAVPTDIFQSSANGRLGATVNEYFRGMVPDNANSLGCTLSADGNFLFFPKDMEQGRFWVHMKVGGYGFNLAPLGAGPPQNAWPFLATNCSIVPFFGPSLYSFGTTLNTTAQFSQMSIDFVVDITGNNARLEASLANIAWWPQPNPTPANGWDMLLVITAMNQNSSIPVLA